MNHKVLVIEDNPEVRSNIADILRLGNYEVLEAANGKVGVETAQQIKPDLILCDVMMPELDGYGVLYVLDKDPETAMIPFIFLTAKSELRDIREGMGLGADDYITKPFDDSKLLKVVETRIRKRERLTSLFGGTISGIDDFYDRVGKAKEFQTMALHRRRKIVKKKEMLFFEGQDPNELYFLEKGEIKTFKTSRDGKELVTGIHHDKSFIGFLALLENTPYKESAVALQDSEAYLISKDDFQSLIYSNRDIARQFIRQLANDLSEMEDRLLEVAYQSVRQRVAGSLLKASEKLGEGRKTELITISRRDIAGIVGTATESLNRTLADFRDEGAVELLQDGIRIVNVSKLERIMR